MDIFTTSIRSYLEESLIIDSKSGRFKVPDSLERIVISSLSPKFREKVFGINNKKLPQLIANHKVSSSVEQAILDDNIICLKEIGVLSSETPREKLQEIIVKAFDVGSN